MRVDDGVCANKNTEENVIVCNLFLSLVFSILLSFVSKTKFIVVLIVRKTFSFPSHNKEGIII